MALFLFFGCSKNLPCKANTVTASLTFDEGSAAADIMQVTVAVTGQPPKLYQPTKPAGMTGNTLEIDLGDRYAPGRTVSISVVALHDGTAVGSGNAQVVLAAACAKVTVAVLATPSEPVMSPDLGPVSRCPPTQTECDGLCVSTQEDPNHCGECGKRCSAGQSCTAGVCACPAATPDACGSDANAFCTNAATDPANCGGCGNSCGANACVDGACTGCPPQLANVDGKCVLPAACTSGADGNLPWTVCGTDSGGAWVSFAGGNDTNARWHINRICKALGYRRADAFGGNCGVICGTCNQTGVSCMHPGAKIFDNNAQTNIAPECGTGTGDDFVICGSPNWHCTSAP